MLDVIVDAFFFEPGFEQVRGASRDVLIDVNGNDVEVHRRTCLELKKSVEQNIAVFSAAHRHSDFVAVFDHAVIGAGHGAKTNDAFFELAHRHRGFNVLARRNFDEFGFVGAAFHHAHRALRKIDGFGISHE